MPRAALRASKRLRTKAKTTHDGARPLLSHGVHDNRHDRRMEFNVMPRNTLKSFPTAALRRGMANFHPASRGCGHAPPRDAADGEGGRPYRVRPIEPTPAPVTLEELVTTAA